MVIRLDCSAVLFLPFPEIGKASKQWRRRYRLGSELVNALIQVKRVITQPKTQHWQKYDR
jgi:hypothetical protein